MVKSIVNLVTALVLLFLVIVGAAILWYQGGIGRRAEAGQVKSAPVTKAEKPKETVKPRSEAPDPADVEDPLTGMERILRASREFRQGVANVTRELTGNPPAKTQVDEKTKTKQPDGPAAPVVKKETKPVEVKTTPSPEILHVVVEGDTLYGIARQHYGAGSRWAEIAEANGIADGHILRGQKLRIPGVKPPVETAEKK